MFLSASATLASAQLSGTDLTAPVPQPPTTSSAPVDAPSDDPPSDDPPSSDARDVAPGAESPQVELSGEAAPAAGESALEERAAAGTAGAPSAPGEADATEAGAGSVGPAQPTMDDPMSSPSAIVIDAAAYGVDPVVGQHVTYRVRATAAEMGYVVLSPEATVAAAQRGRMPYPPSPADLWRVSYVARARRGVFARVWAHEGRYVFELTVASLDGSGPFFARGTSGAEDLHEVVAQLTRQALPAVEAWDLAGYQRYATSAAASPAPVLPPDPATLRPVVPVRPTRVVVDRRRRDNRPGRRLDLALQVEAAIGADDRFANALVGARFGVRITKSVAVGLQVAYANLRGRGERVSNVLPMLMVENRIRISSRLDLTVPLRFAIGYLPFNGPVVRFAAGLNLPLSGRVELQLDVLAPTFWVLPDERTAVSLDPALELIVRL